MRAAPPVLSALILACAWPACAQPDPEEPDAAAPPAATEQPAPPAEAYDSRVRSSFAAAESFQGPLDGGWTLSAADEGRLYALQFSDHGGKLEAAWRDLRRAGALNASGFVDEVQRSGGRLSLRFSPRDGVLDTAILSTSTGVVWTGELDENGRRRPVSLVKTGP